MSLLLAVMPSSFRVLLLAVCVLLGVVQCSEVVYVDMNLLGQLNTSSPALSLIQQIAVDNEGAVYIADQNNYRVVKLSINSGAQLAVYSGSGGAASNPLAPLAVTISSANNLFVTDASNSRIVEFDGQGNITRVLPVAGGYVSALAVAVDGAGRLYYIDDTDYSVVQLDVSSGNITLLLNASQPYLNRPTALSVDSSGNVHVAYAMLSGRDPRSASVVVFSPAGTVLSMFSYYNYTVYGNSAQPVCLAIDAYSNVFLGDTNNNAVYKMDASGNLLALYNSSSRATSFNPRGCAVDNAGHLLIATVRNIVLVTSSLNPIPNGNAALEFRFVSMALTVAIVAVSLMLEIALA